MNILMALSQKELTGAERYATTLSQVLIQRGHRVSFVSDSFAQQPPGPLYRLAFNKRNLFHRLWHIIYLLWLFHKEKIQLVHAHSRASRWSCALACKIYRIPLVSSVHGRQPIHASSQRFPMLGQAAIVVCENLKIHLQQDFPKIQCPVFKIGNGIDTQVFTMQKKQILGTKLQIGIAGRLTGPKGELCFQLLDQVLDNTQHHIRVATSSQIPKRFCTFTHIEWVIDADMPTFYTQCDLIIGAGRVAIEALLVGRPVFAIGEACCLGWINATNLEEALASNFGDISLKHSPINYQALKIQFKNLKEPPAITTSIQAKIQSCFDVLHIANEVEHVYQSMWVNYKKREMPILMYHRFITHPNQAGVHGTWVDVKQFEQHLAWLQSHGFESITFSDLESRKLISRLALGKRWVMITVDDGYQDSLTELVPLLKKYNFKAVLYVVTDESYNRWDVEHTTFPEKKLPLLTPEQLQEVVDSGCIEIGGHTQTHPRLTQLTRLEKSQEIQLNKQKLEALLGQPVLSFAYPFGEYDEVTKTIVKQTGYQYAVATDSGPCALHEDLWTIRRISIFPSTNLRRFRRKMSGRYVFHQAARTN